MKLTTWLSIASTVVAIITLVLMIRKSGCLGSGTEEQKQRTAISNGTLKQTLAEIQ